MTSPLPSAELLQRLTEEVRRDPGSPAFVELGEAFLRLGRPRDAVEVGARGLKLDPQNLAGRMMVSHAFVALHQWKQAQAELLKVVKTDRSNARGFCLLGEVLMRRADYERALPVLQHAQNLDPANPSILALLKRARAGQPLDPPPPIPTPRQAPAGASRPSARLPQPRNRFDEVSGEDPTRVAADTLGAEFDGDTDQMLGPATEPGLPSLLAEQDAEPIAARMPLAPPAATGVRPNPLSAPPPPAKRPSPPSAFAKRESPPNAPAKRPSPPSAPAKRPSPPPPSAPPPAKQARVQPSSAKQPQPKPSVRPRILPAEKPKDAAREGLRQSAAMGEEYLNNLLTGGLLDVPGVRVADPEYDIKPGKRWGRSSRRAYIALFVLLIMGVAGGTTWYFYAKKQRAQDVARHLAEARRLMATATFDDLAAAMRECKAALDRDKSNVEAMAVFAEIGGLSALLYRSEAERADLAATTVEKEIDGKKSRRGYREVLIGRAAVTIALLSEIEKPVEKLTEVRARLAEFIAENPQDSWARWLQGKARLAAGDRKKARADFEKAYDNGKGPLVAAIDLADMDLDDADYDAAMKRYAQASERSKHHPLVLLGRSLARAERGTGAAETMDDLKVGLAMGPSKERKGLRVDAYRNLGLAYVSYAEQEFVDFEKALKKAIGMREPRFLARVALAHLNMGRVKEAAELRARVRFYGKNSPEPNPLVVAVDAALLISAGLPAEAGKLLHGVPGLRAHQLRGRALLDQGKAADALRELEKAAQIAPDSRDLEMWTLAARLVAGPKRGEASKKLRKLAREADSKAVSYAHGWALLERGSKREARRLLERSLEELSQPHPNPLAYRAHLDLARLDYEADKLDDAFAHLQKSLELNPGYLPAHGLLGVLQMKKGNPAKAAEELVRLVDRDLATGEQSLVYAQALAASNEEITGRELELARKAITTAHARKVDAAALAAAAWAIDKELAGKLGLPQPGGEDAKTPPKKKKKKRRR